METGAETLLCDTSTGKDRPAVPKRYRSDIFDKLHRIPLPSVRATIRLRATRLSWPDMNNDERLGTLTCEVPQTSGD